MEALGYAADFTQDRRKVIAHRAARFADSVSRDLPVSWYGWEQRPYQAIFHHRDYFVQGFNFNCKSCSRVG